MSVQAGPAGLIRLHGTLVVRRAGWLDLDEWPDCPFEHPLKEHGRLHDGRGVFWCKHQPALHEAECGALIYIVRIPAVGTYCADVTTEEMRHIEREHMTASQVFRYLGVRFPGGMRARARQTA